MQTMDKGKSGENSEMSRARRSTGDPKDILSMTLPRRACFGACSEERYGMCAPPFVRPAALTAEELIVRDLDAAT